MDSSLREAQKYFQDDHFATETTGIVIEAVREGYARCAFDIETRHLNANGVLMGGAIFTLADFTFAVAANTGQLRSTVSLDSHIAFLRVAKGRRLIAEAHCVKAGRSTCCYDVAVADELGTQVAHVTITGFCIAQGV